MRLEHWSVRSRPFGQLQPPEQEGGCVLGLVMGHPSHRDGREVLTSTVLRAVADRIVTKSGSEYELGAVDPTYESCYPGALQRLLSRLKAGPLEQDLSTLTCASRIAD